ncbi:hypothetical protein [Desulfovibrio sp.]|uniref:hypothetical protein n=1 Tax=Desulfovibrio sp. TaxID=885 RepID=UPI0023CF4BB6|nr:hypothetical protein [Desulfovibrio sp.]MDE7241467.1 hypothetical protein [Desulfovibrio sp.]
MRDTYTTTEKRVKPRPAVGYTLRIDGRPVRVRATRAAVIELVRLLLGRPPVPPLEVRI